MNSEEQNKILTRALHDITTEILKDKPSIEEIRDIIMDTAKRIASDE